MATPRDSTLRRAQEALGGLLANGPGWMLGLAFWAAVLPRRHLALAPAADGEGEQP